MAQVFMDKQQAIAEGTRRPIADGESGPMHASNGFFFKRLSDGGVIVFTADGSFEGMPRAVQEACVFDASTWASVVAFVSKHGDNAASWERARAFHNGA